MSKKLIVANWKMNPPTVTEAVDFFGYITKNSDIKRGLDLVVCPPNLFLPAINYDLRSYKNNIQIHLGAQNVHWESSGAFTGEISAQMLKEFGVEYVIIGHSERRWIMGETDEMINKKIKAALKSGLTPILAVGEKER